MSPATITKLDSVSFDKLIEAQLPFSASEPVLDLSGVTMITPSPIVQMAAMCHALALEGRAPTIVVQEDSVRTYLSRCGFFQAIREVAEVNPDVGDLDSQFYSARRGLNPMLIEVTHLADGHALPDLLDRIVWVLRNRLKYRKYDAFDVATVVSELCQNSFDHNQGISGFVAMQVYGSGSKRFLEVAVSDHGDGLTSTLRRNPKNTGIGTDLDAINAAIRLGTSEHDDPTRGTRAVPSRGDNLQTRGLGSDQIRTGQDPIPHGSAPGLVIPSMPNTRGPHLNCPAHQSRQALLTCPSHISYSVCEWKANSH